MVLRPHEGQGKKEAFPEVSEWLKPRLDQLGTELKVSLRVAKVQRRLTTCSAILDRDSEEFRCAMQPVVERLNTLPPSSALQFVASYCELVKAYKDNTRLHFEKNRQRFSQFDFSRAAQGIQALPVQEALQTISDCYRVFYRLLGKGGTQGDVLTPVLARLEEGTSEQVDWNARVEVLASLLHQIAQEIRRADRKERFSQELAITVPVSRAILVLLKKLAQSKATVDSLKMHILIGELVRTWTQGFKRNWPYREARQALQQPILDTGLVNKAEFEKIFDLATSKAHQNISFKSIREEYAAGLQADKPAPAPRQNSRKPVPEPGDKGVPEDEIRSSNRSNRSDRREPRAARHARRQTDGGRSVRPPEDTAEPKKARSKKERDPDERDKCIVC